MNYPEFHIDSDTFELSYRFWDNDLLIVWPRGSKEYEWLSEWETYAAYLDARAFVERYERENNPSTFNMEYPVDWEMGADGWITIKPKSIVDDERSIT